VLPLVPGYISMLSALAWSSSAKGRANLRPVLFGSRFRRRLFRRVHFLRRIRQRCRFLPPSESRSLAPVAGALILLFGLHLIGALIKLNLRAALSSACSSSPSEWPRFFARPAFCRTRAAHFFSLSLIGFFGPAMARWLNRDVHLRSKSTQPGIWSGFLLASRSPSVDALHRPHPRHRSCSRRRQRHHRPRVLLLAVYSAGLAIPFLLTALASASSWFSTRIFENIFTPSNSSARFAFVRRRTGLRQQTDLALG